MKHLLIKNLILLFSLFFANSIVTIGQSISSALTAANFKQPIDTSILGKWPRIHSPYISCDANFVAYTIGSQLNRDQVLVIQSVNHSWKREIYNIVSLEFCVFSNDNKTFIYKNGEDLIFLTLGSDLPCLILKVKSCKWPASKKGEWLAYQLKGSQQLVLLNLLTRKEVQYSCVSFYAFDENGRTLLLQNEYKQDSIKKSSIDWINLSDSKRFTIWHNNFSNTTEVKLSRRNYNFSNKGDQLVFLASKSTVLPANEDKIENSIWFYKIGMEKAVIKVDCKTPGIDSFLSVTGTPEFSGNDQWIFFYLESTQDNRIPDPNSVKVDVWSYKDKDIQPEQLRKISGSTVIRSNDGPERFLSVININGKFVTRLERQDEKILFRQEKVTGDYAVLMDQVSVGNKYWWPFAPQPSFYLIFLKDGSRKLLKKNISLGKLDNFSFSPSGKYLIFWNSDESDFFSYNIEEGIMSNITQSLPVSVSKEEIYTYSLDYEAVAPVAGWQNDDASLLIYDNYDIWIIDPANKKQPINITNGYGRKHSIKLNLVYGPGENIQDQAFLTYNLKDTLLLTAFNSHTKSNGFYQVIPNKKGDPELLTMGPYTYYRTNSQNPDLSSLSNDIKPIKASKINGWIVQRQSATEAPNLFFSNDFKTFKQLTHLRPQENYNWLTAELISWSLPNGVKVQGILYKPEDFDPQKKYPIIFNYYKQVSHQLYEFPYPAYTSTNINIPWFVSNGYLVFRPDIYYSINNKSKKEIVGESANNAIVSAAKYLSKQPYINSKRMAIQGHSVGGGETNYIITHSNLFAAAVEFAGVSDPVSNFLTLIPFLSSIEHGDRLSRTETFSGATPWERPDLYNKGSSVMNADKIKTPLLIVHNMRDNQIPWRQGVELYMALRRLGKKVWMLQYDQGDHSITGKDAIDYTIRLTQFLDYYLKETLPPKWMTEGIPAKLKGIESKYEIDSSGKIP